MTTPNHPVTCPKCGGQLQPVALDPNTAPWLCPICSRGFWASELTNESRALHRPNHDDFGFAPVALRASVELEIADAQTRGTSLREDQFTLTPTQVLDSLATRPGLDPTFLASLHADISSRAVK